MTDPSPDHADLLEQAMARISELQARVDQLENDASEPIAIVGVGCRLPGGADSPEAFWQLLVDGRDNLKEIPAQRWDLDDYFHDDPDTPGKIYTRSACFLDGVDDFDPMFFGISPREAAVMDPQQRLLLVCAWEALERARIAPTDLAGSSTGVFIGNCFHDYQDRAVRRSAPDDCDVYSATGVAPSVLSGRISYLLGLNGPSFTADTACSSSLLAAHLAAQSLRRRECDLAIIGGANLILDPMSMLSLARARMLAPDGRSKAFDETANGYGRGEGIVAMAAKRLSDATADGDQILAVVLGSATNQDGASKSLAVPSGDAQEAVIRQALADARVELDDISYVEAHGTGTPVGDPIEATAIGTVFQPLLEQGKRIELGSVKANIGHLEGAAGIAGLLKVVLSLHHRELPGHRLFTEPTSAIPWDEFPLEIGTEHRAWEVEPNRRRVAGINSFGFSGSNVHMIVAEAPATATEPTEDPRSPQVLALGASSAPGLEAQVDTYLDHLATSDDRFADIAFSSQTTRSHHRDRLSVVATDIDEARDRLRTWREHGSAPGVHAGTALAHNADVAFLFTGQGAQYADMARELYEHEPVFREHFDACCAGLDAELDVPLADVIWPADGGSGLIDQTTYTQPALFALEYSLARLWQSWGLEPAVLLGHSVGEYAAACIAGVFSLPDALRLIAARGRLMGALPAGGAMMSVRTDEATLAPLVEPLDLVSIAAFNGPESLVVSGDGDQVAQLGARLEQDGIKTQPLTVSHAFHSPLMDPMLEEFRAIAATVEFQAPSRRMVSNVTGEIAGPEIASADYWVDHVRGAVRFHQGMAQLDADGLRTFLEIGPQPTLLGMGRGCVASPTHSTWIPSLKKGAADRATITSAVAELQSTGVPIDWRAFDPAARAVDLPTQTFLNERYWQEFAGGPSQVGGAWNGPLLGHRVETAIVDAPVYHSSFSVDSPTHLGDHRIFDHPLFPAAGFLEMTFAAAADVNGGETVTVADVSIREALGLTEDGFTDVQLAAVRDGHDVAVDIHSADGDSWKHHFSGRVVGSADAAPAVDIDALLTSCPDSMSGEEYYDLLAADGYNYGPLYQSATEAHFGENHAVVRLELPDDLDDEGYTLHPVLLDGALQPIGMMATRAGAGDGDSLFLPVFVDRVALQRTGVRSGWVDARLTQQLDEIVRSDITIYNDDGEPVVVFERFAAKRARRATVRQMLGANYDSWLYEIAWRPEPAASDERSLDGAWIVFADAPDDAAATAAAIAQDGGWPTVVVPSTHVGELGSAVAVDVDDPDALRAWIVAHLDGLDDVPFAGVVSLWGSTADQPRDPDAIGDRHRSTAGRLLSCMQTLTVDARAHVTADPALRFVIATVGGQDVGSQDVTSPLATSLSGLARTAQSEHPELGVVALDIVPGVDLADAVVTELAQRDPASQVAVRPDGRHVARLVTSPRPPLPLPDEPGYQLRAPERGTLDNLTLLGTDRPDPGPGEVEIKVRASGLNFRDVLNVLGMYPGDPGEVGIECAGTITAVGDGVERWRIGDDVVAISQGTFRSHLVIDAGHVHRKPANVSFAEAATIPVTFLTAHYGLHELARIQQGERVLVHAASGGVGMAAIQIAKLEGAEIFGTAGAQWKKDLVADLGADHVLHSRSLEFADRIAELTDGAGVDIVLNSLADDFIPKSLGTLGSGGRFLEIGKRGIWTDEQVAEFDDSLGYWAYDLLDVITDQPELVQEMMEIITARMESGDLQPLPVQAFPIQDAVSGFRFMQQARHAGKIVVTMTATDIDPDGTHLVTGGSGGIGRQIIRWLAESGARTIISTSRRGATPELEALSAELEGLGVTLDIVAADAGVEADLDRVLASIDDARPLRGIYHAAGVLDDGAMINQSWDRFETVLRPKVDAGWMLHTKTRHLGIDQFVLFSSISGVIGNAGQANYATANTWLDGLAAARRREGLAALSVNWGPWAEVGMAAETPKALLDATGMQMMPPAEACGALAQVLTRGRSQVAIAALGWDRLATLFADDPFFAEVLAERASSSRQSGGRAAANSEILSELEAATVRERNTLMLEFVNSQLARVLGLDPSQRLDPQLGLFDVGMDSLTAVEFSNRLEDSFGQPLPPTLAFEAPTIEALAGLLLGELALPDAPADDDAAEPDDEDTTAELEAEVDALSEDEALASLLSELSD